MLPSFNTAFKSAQESGDWQTATLLESIPTPEGRIPALVRLFQAAAAHDDVGAKRVLGYIVVVLREAEETPIRQNEDVYSRECVAAMERASAAIVSMVATLWNHLADVPHRNLETRKVMLNIVAERWICTPDLAEEAQCIEFLFAAMDSSFPVDQSKAAEHALRAALVGDAIFPRLRRAYRTALATQWRYIAIERQREIMRMLRTGWARNRGSVEFADTIDIDHALFGVTASGMAYAKKIAGDIAEFDKNLRELMAHLARYRDGGTCVESVWVKYDSLDRAEIVIWFGARESATHQAAFGALCAEARGWSVGRRPFELRLTCFVAPRSTASPRTWERSEII